MKSALVIGGGAFGTSIASILSHSVEKVFILVRSQELFDDLKDHVNNKYLPELILPENIIPILNWSDITVDPSILVSGLPAKAIDDFFNKNKNNILNFLNDGIPLVSLSKGIDPESLELPDDRFFEIFPNHKDQFCFLSGPSFAKEIVEKQITMVSLAGKSRDVLEKSIEILESEYFKIIPTFDIKGVLLGGALKNIVAIAGGIVEGLGYNHNTRAALITRGIQEMLRFGKVFNARPETFYGLSGMGDLILTTTGGLSRNKAFGVEVARGFKAQSIINKTSHVVEGFKTTKAAYLISQKFKLRTQLFDGMYHILYEDASPTEVIQQLMNMPINFD